MFVVKPVDTSRNSRDTLQHRKRRRVGRDRKRVGRLIITATKVVQRSPQFEIKLNARAPGTIKAVS
jgi:hypothetical protein